MQPDFSNCTVLVIAEQSFVCIGPMCTVQCSTVIMWAQVESWPETAGARVFLHDVSSGASRELQLREPNARYSRLDWTAQNETAATWNAARARADLQLPKRTEPHSTVEYK